MVGGRPRRIALAASLSLLLLLWLPISPSDAGTADRGAVQAGGAVHVGHLSGVIDPIAAQYLARIVDRAEREDAAALVLVLDTPGGLESAMRAMVQRMLAANVPLVVYVAHSGARAASAGVFITMAANVAAMAPGTNLGAAHPVSLGGGTDPVLAEKAANDAAASARTLATQRGRNADWADRAVRQSISATEAEAVAENVVDLVARDLDELLERIDGRTVATAGGSRALATRGAPRVAADMTVVEAALHTLLDPEIAFLLLNLGFLGLIAELYHPGALIPGLTGGIAILLGMVALGTLPLNWGGAILLLLAFALFLADVYATAHGVLSVAGVVAFMLGGTLLFSPVEVGPIEALRGQAGPLAVDPWLVAAIAAVFALYFLVVARAALWLRRAPPLELAPGVGQVGVAVTPLAPGGVVRVGAEEWSAILDATGGAAADGPGESAADVILAGKVVDVVGRDGLRLRVRRAAAAAATGAEEGTWRR